MLESVLANDKRRQTPNKTRESFYFLDNTNSSFRLKQKNAKAAKIEHHDKTQEQVDLSALDLKLTQKEGTNSALP